MNHLYKLYMLSQLKKSQYLYNIYNRKQLYKHEGQKIGLINFLYPISLPSAYALIKQTFLSLTYILDATFLCLVARNIYIMHFFKMAKELSL